MVQNPKYKTTLVHPEQLIVTNPQLRMREEISGSEDDQIDEDDSENENDQTQNQRMDLDQMIRDTHSLVKQIKRSNELQKKQSQKHTTRISKLEDQVSMLSKIVVQQDRVIKRLNDKQT